MIRRCLIVLLVGFFTSSFLIAQDTNKLKPGDIFPVVKGELLSFDKITLPNHCKGKVSVLIVAFKRETQPQVDTWAKPLL